MLYTIDNLDALGSHVITLLTDSIVYLGIKSDLMFPAYFSYLSAELDENYAENGRALIGHQESPLWHIPHWHKDYVIGHFWTGNEPCDITVSHELSGYVPEYGPVEREVTRYSLTLSGENGEADKTYLYDVLSVGSFYGNNSSRGIMVRDEDENALVYAAYIHNRNATYKIGKRIRQIVGYGINENTIIKFDNDVLFPNIFFPDTQWFKFDGSHNLSATSLGTVTIQDFPIAEYKPVVPKKIDIKLKVEEKSYAYIYHPAVSGGE